MSRTKGQPTGRARICSVGNNTNTNRPVTLHINGHSKTRHPPLTKSESLRRPYTSDSRRQVGQTWAFLTCSLAYAQSIVRMHHLLRENHLPRPEFIAALSHNLHLSKSTRCGSMHGSLYSRSPTRTSYHVRFEEYSATSSPPADLR